MAPGLPSPGPLILLTALQPQPRQPARPGSGWSRLTRSIRPAPSLGLIATTAACLASVLVVLQVLLLAGYSCCPSLLPIPAGAFSVSVRHGFAIRRPAG